MSEEGIHNQAVIIFRRAAAYIRHYGWQEKGMGLYGQPRCSMGALASAHPQGQWDPGLAAFMYNALSEELHGLSLTQFNHQVSGGEAVALLYEHVASTIQSKSHQSVAFTIC